MCKDNNTGGWNTGGWNTGNSNTGDWNTGGWNTGYYNTGNCNTGNRNTGNYNTGDSNTGDCNTGDWNTGERNTGDYNTGDCNTGDYNTGDCNTGDWNTGDWNTTDFSSGCFNTIKQSIMLFNKPSDWTYEYWLNSEAKRLLDNIKPSVMEWISDHEMTDEEKEANPLCITTGGYLKVLDESECAQRWWDGLDEEKRNIVKAIPNFDPEIFAECTGINTECAAKNLAEAETEELIEELKKREGVSIADMSKSSPLLEDSKSIILFYGEEIK